MMLSTNNKPKIIAVVGPTASGKSDLAVDMALFIKKNAAKLGVSGAEIISADSRQVYKGMDIGSNKITVKEMRGIPHHLISIANPKTTFSAARYQRLAARIIKKILKNNKIPIICGGTGFYIDSVIYGIKFPKTKPNTALRKKLEKMETEKLFMLLQKKDPTRAISIDRHNRRRLIRALEINFLTGMPVPILKKEPQFETLWLGLTADNHILKNKLSNRLDKRLKKGLLKEVRNLHKKYGLSWKRLESFGLEYKFTAQFLEKKISEKEMKNKIVDESANYAKRQMTWFKRNSEINWIKDKQKALGLTESFLLN